MKKFVIATSNKGKINEFLKIFADLPVQILTLDDIKFTEEIEEIGSTYQENALIKARRVSEVSSSLSVAEDSGIEIDALKGELGLYSARYSKKRDDATVNQEILERLRTVKGKDRACRYKAVVAFVDRSKNIEICFDGSCEGIIASEAKGNNGFGFDPIFYLPDRKMTMAEISADEKNKISHRGVALRKFKEYCLKNLF